MDELPTPETPVLHIGQYEDIPFAHVLDNPSTSLSNAYIIRKALIRKHYLSTTAYNWITKNPLSILATNIKPSCDFEVDYAEFLDDALVEAWELKESWKRGEEGNAEGKREWWILKPGMSDRGQGIRLFSSEEELQTIFDGWEADRPDSDDEEEDEDNEEDATNQTAKDNDEGKKGDFIITSHLRHFIVQPYIDRPLLIFNTKFHIRTYVLAYGSLQIYVYKPMLALFASVPYSAPTSSSSSSTPTTPEDTTISLLPHLTNTCLQTSSSSTPSSIPVRAFWTLPLPPATKHQIFTQICAVTGEVFEAAARGMMIHFQTLPNAFEVFGLDFLVDGSAGVWLLEVNAFPDFRQTGGDAR